MLKTLEGLRILCVDDNQDSLTLLSRVLRSDGAVTTTCLSGAGAIAALKSVVFDVVISDISMPEMDGFDLIHALRRMEGAEPSHLTPAIALSSAATLPNCKKRFADFQVYMTKPLDRKRLVDLVKRLADADGEAVTAGSLDLLELDRQTAVILTSDSLITF